MNVFSYIVAHDTGFAPNPFWGVCTLACCKPRIRRAAAVDDLIVGLSPKAQGNRIVYMMRVSERLIFAEYWKSPEYRCKRPSPSARKRKCRCGDNIYCPLGRDNYLQQPSKHSNHDGTENAKLKAVDLGGKYVLVSREFAYFGSDAMPLPKAFAVLLVGRGHRKFTEIVITRMVEKFFQGLPKGRHGRPRRWPVDDETEATKRCCRR